MSLAGRKPKESNQLEIHTDRAMNCSVVLSKDFFFVFSTCGDPKLTHMFLKWLAQPPTRLPFFQATFFLKGEAVKAKIDNSD